MSAYTWFWTGKGPQWQWLYRIGKAEDASCLCGATTQSGTHIVWECRLHRDKRRRNGIEEGAGSWEGLDKEVWVRGEGAKNPNDRVDGAERFFDYLSYQF